MNALDNSYNSMNDEVMRRKRRAELQAKINSIKTQPMNMLQGADGANIMTAQGVNNQADIRKLQEELDSLDY